MKKILLTCVIAMSIFATEAQKTKSGAKKTKKATISNEAKVQAAIAKQAAERQAKFKLDNEERLLTDSLRKEDERVAAEKFETDRKAWTENRLREIDSTNKANWSALSQDKEQSLKAERNWDEINKAAKLNEYQGTQVKFINQSYSNKAKTVKENIALTDDLKKEQLSVLNTERKARIKSVLGNSKAKKLAKEQKKFETKYGADAELAWVSEVEGYANNK
jgi:carbamoylphosphate synthase small subunit